jgi:hypothetical protein
MVSKELLVLPVQQALQELQVRKDPRDQLVLQEQQGRRDNKELQELRVRKEIPA